MSTIYIQYPQNAGGSGNTGSQTGVAYSVNLDGAAKSSQGGVIGSFTFYQQSADQTFPGLVSSAAQTFSGVKTFNSQPVLAGLGSAPLRVASDVVITGSISLTNEVSGRLPEDNLSSTSAAYLVGPLDGAAASGNAAVIGSYSIYMQSASATNPGIVSSASQTFGGIKTFNAGVYPSGNVYLPAGAVTAPSLTFDGSSSSGIYVVSSSNWAMAVNGVLGLSFIKSTGGFANLGFGGQAPSNQDAFTAWTARSQNNNTLVRIDNTNSGALAASGIQMVGNGVSSFVLGYSSTASGDMFAAKTSVNNVSGRGVSLISSATAGDISAHVGGVKQFVVSSAGAFLQTLNSGPTRTLNGIFATGSISLTNEVVGVLPNANMSAVNLSTAAQVVGSLSLTQLNFAVLNNPMTTPGDIIVGSAAGATARLPIGASGQVLTVSSGATTLAWAAPATNSYYNGYSGSAIFTTGQTTFTDPIVIGTTSLVTRVSAGGIQVSPISAGNLPGIVYQPASVTAAYRITMTFQGIGTNAGANMSWRMTDGAELAIGKINQPVDGSSVGGGSWIVLDGISAPATTSSVTVKIQGSVSVGSNSWGSSVQFGRPIQVTIVRIA